MGSHTRDTESTTESSVASPTPEVAATGVDNEAERTRVRAELGQLARDIRDLTDARIRALERLAEDTTPAAVSNENRDFLIAGALIAVGAATAGIGGIIGAAVAAGAAGAAKEFVKSATKDVIDTQLNGLVSGAVEGYLDGWTGGDSRKAFFRGPSDAMHNAKGAIDRDILSSWHEDLVLEDANPVGLVRELQDGVRSNIETAGAEQRKESLVAWLNLLARVDLGSTDEGGIDAGEAGLLGETWLEQQRRIFWADPPRGIVRMKVRGDDTHEGIDILETKISGLNDELVEVIAGFDEPIGDLGLTLYVYGDTYAHLPDESGYMEIGKNPTGGYFTEASVLGETWLSYFSRGERTEVDDEGDVVRFVSLAEEGTQRLIDEYVGSQRFADLGWENNAKHGRDGVPQHG